MAEKLNGWIKIHRKMLDWEWYDEKNVLILFIHILLKANFRENIWKGHSIKRGEFITSYGNLASETGLSIQQVRTALDKLKSTNEITVKTTNKFTVITIEKYTLYQDGDQENNKQRNTQTDTQITTTKERKESLRNIYSEKPKSKTKNGFHNFESSRSNVEDFEKILREKRGRNDKDRIAIHTTNQEEFNADKKK
jgi:DNA-binding transcriptional regulator YhcF (GntR family)